MSEVAAGIAIRAVSLILGLAVGLVIIRGLPVEDFGEYSLHVSLFIVAVALSGRGIEMLLHREVAHNKGESEKVAEIVQSLQGPWIARIALGVICFTLTIPVAKSLGVFPDLRWEVGLAMGTTVGSAGLMLAISAVEMGSGRPIRALIPFHLVQPAVFLLILVSIEAASISSAVIAFSASYLAGAIVSILIKSFDIPKRRLSSVVMSEEHSKAHPFLFRLVVTQLVLGETDIVMVGFLLTEVDLSLFAAARRIAGLIAVGLGTVNSMLCWRIGKTYTTAGQVELQREVRYVARWAALIAFPPTLLLFFFSNELLEVLGQDYVDARPILLVLLAGQLFQVAAGPSLLTLLMCNQDERSSRIGITSSMVKFVATPLFTLYGGGVGAAAAVSAVMALQSLLGVRAARHSLSVSTIVR